MRHNTCFRVLSLMILAGAILRVLPHPWNFTPVGAMALFAGATFPRRREAFLVPLSIMVLGDLGLELTTGFGIHSGMPIIYGCFALTVVLGLLLRERRNSALAVGGAATLSATIFYLVTNFYIWTVSPLYAKTAGGLITCYIAALPYYGNNLAADWIYSGLLFGTFVWAERRYPALRLAAAE